MLSSLEEPCITRVAAVYSFDRMLNPRRGVYYIYMCVCVCVCVCVCACAYVSGRVEWFGNICFGIISFFSLDTAVLDSVFHFLI